MSSWRQTNPDFEVRVWSEHNFDVAQSKYAARALELKRYAFVSDYVRAVVLVDQGGVYLDADVELKGSLEPFLRHAAFTGFETPGLPVTAVWGSTAGHPLARAVLDYYEDREYEVTEKPNTVFIAEIMATEFKVDVLRDELQEGAEGLTVYPSHTFCLDLPSNVASHHFYGSWLPGTSNRYKAYINSAWHLEKALEHSNRLGDHVMLARVLGQLGFRRSSRAALHLLLAFGYRLAQRAVTVLRSRGN
jgi:hypothetical protein